MRRLKINVRGVCAAGLMAGVTAALSPLAIPLPFSPVPVTLSLLAVFSAGVLLTPGLAFASELAYLLVGAAGAPVFSAFRGGPGVLFGSTGGFLLSYPLMALTVSLISGGCAGRGLRGAARTVCALSSATLICYAAGAAWLALSAGMSVSAALTAAVWPFVPFDALKIAAAAAVLPSVRRAIDKTGVLGGLLTVKRS